MIEYDRFFSRSAIAMKESAIRKAGGLLLRSGDLISFAPGFPSPDTFPWPDLQAITQSLLSGADPWVLQYGATRGYRPLIEALGEMLAERGISATPDEILVTTGSQQALDLTARVFVDPGAVVLVELPTYTGAISAFRDAGAQLVGVRQDADGIDLEDLDRLTARERAAGRRIAFLYVVLNFQNPTGVLVSRAKRQQLLEWAARQRVLIVEDDPYGALYFDDVATEAEIRPMKADDMDGRVVYLSSFSKTIAPALRVAWVAAPAPIAAKLELAKQSADLCTGGVDQRIVYEVLKRGLLRDRLPRLRRFYQQQSRAMAGALRRELPGLASWSEPRGGFFVWAELSPEIDTDALLGRAIARGVVFVAGSAFFFDRRPSRCLRLSFSAAVPERIDEGVRRLAAAVHEEVRTTASGSPSADPYQAGPRGSAAVRPAR